MKLIATMRTVCAAGLIMAVAVGCSSSSADGPTSSPSPSTTATASVIDSPRSITLVMTCSTMVMIRLPPGEPRLQEAPLVVGAGFRAAALVAEMDFHPGDAVGEAAQGLLHDGLHLAVQRRAA